MCHFWAHCELDYLHIKRLELIILHGQCDITYQSCNCSFLPIYSFSVYSLWFSIYSSSSLSPFLSILFINWAVPCFHILTQLSTSNDRVPRKQQRLPKSDVITKANEIHANVIRSTQKYHIVNIDYPMHLHSSSNVLCPDSRSLIL